MEHTIKRITIIGVGLIGGSVAAAAKAFDPKLHIFGIDTSKKGISSGIAQGLLDGGCDPDSDEATRATSGEGSDLIVLATPVDQSIGWLDRLAQNDYRGILTDVSSTKNIICEAAAATLPHPELFIPGHPMAGSEMSGIEASSPTLFQGAYWILCPDESTGPDAYQSLHEFVVSLGARVISLNRADHDDAVAIVSHVPHMVASSLVRLAGKHAEKQPNLLRLAAGGFKDSTRIAAGSPGLWCGIAFDNTEAVADGLSEFAAIIGQFEDAIRRHDEDKLTELLAYSASIRRDLPSKWVPSSARLVECRIPMYNRSGVIAEVTTIASKVGCNIQSIDIDHMSEDSAVLEMTFTDEGDIGRLTGNLIDAGYDVALRPLAGE